MLREGRRGGECYRREGGRGGEIRGGLGVFMRMKIYGNVESGFLKFLIYNGGNNSLLDGGYHLRLSIYGDADFGNLIMFFT
jgi:hypothetical protein